MPVVSDHTALRSGYSWLSDITQPAAAGIKGTTFVTYCFLENNEVPSTLSYQPFYNTGYFGMSAAQRSGFRDAISELERVCGVRLIEVNDPADAQIEIMNTDGSEWGGWSNYPSSFSGVRLVIDGEGSYSRGTVWFETILHELGHAMGLKHPFEGANTLRASLDDENNTLMSYTSNGIADRTYARFDVTALQDLYGPGAGTTAGWRYGWSEADQQVWVVASAGNDTAIAPNHSARMEGRDGNDRLIGNAQSATLFGGNGDDLLVGSTEDFFTARASGDRLFGDAGRDRIIVSESAAEIFGGSDNDVISCDVGFESCIVLGGSGNDRIELRSGRVTANAGEGDDLFIFSESRNFDSDSLFGGSGRDTLQIDVTAEVSLGTRVPVSFLRVADVETVILRNGGSATGDGLANTLVGRVPADTLSGGGGADVLSGGAGRDRLDGGTGDDKVYGGAGSDRITSTDGGDLLQGGADADVFVLSDVAGRLHRIADFEDGIDRIDLSRFAGTLDAFVIRQSGANTLLYRPGDATHAELRLILTGVRAAEVTADDFF